MTDTTTLSQSERLRAIALVLADEYGLHKMAEPITEAADRIDELEASNKKLREALAPFAKYADSRDRTPASMGITHGSAMARSQLTMGHCYAARAALAAKEKADG